MMDELKQSEVTFKFYMPEHGDDVWLTVNAYKMFRLLNLIDQRCRDLLKYDEKASEDKQKLAQEIRDMIYTSVDMDMVK